MELWSPRVNFFGHCVAASWIDDSASVGFGSMLPDLLSMLASKEPRRLAPHLARGVELHHLTDRIFHANARFVRFQSEARQRLLQLGVSKGARLAVAHVGVELILDGFLARDPEHLEVYERALSFGTTLARDWSEDASTKCVAAELRRLASLLASRKASLAPTSGEELSERLGRILAPRPALRIDPEERQAVASWGDTAFDRIEPEMVAWTAELRRSLLAASGPSM